MNKQYGFGWIPDEPDSRDAVYAASNLFATYETAPSSFDARHLVAEVLDQNPLPSCVAQAVNGAIRCVQWHHDGGDAPELTSRFWTWYYARLQHGAHRQVSGTYIRLAIKALNSLGRPPEHVWPHILTDLKEDRPVCVQKPPPVVSAHAYDNRKVSYHRILETSQSRIAAIKRCVSEYKPVVFGTMVTWGFTDLRGPTRAYPKPSPSDVVAGGHAMYIIGYDDEGVTIVNSWGKGWGDGGYAHLSWDYIAWYETQDLWAIDLS